MFSHVATLLRNRADLLLQGAYDAVAADYHFPLPVFLDGRMVIVRTPDEAKAMLCLQRAAYLQRGVIAVRPQVRALDLPRSGRFRVWVEWQELALPVDGTRISDAVYYCQQSPSGLRIEMVNYTRLSMPELQPHFAALALSA